jgi:hypothetical protein
MSEKKGGPPGEDPSAHLPHKPTREAATGTGDFGEISGQRAEPAGAGHQEHLGKDRQEVGDAASSAKHPPHVTPNDEDAPIQDEMMSPQEVPGLPANASGQDKFTPEEQDEPIREESMYDGRPERDKDQPPSKRV